LRVSFLIICFLFAFNTLKAQTINNTNYLVAYGQVWGFLKYFHPGPSTMDWDNVLILDYEKLRNCSTDTSFNVLITHLIDTCSIYKRVERKMPDSLVIHNSFEWIDQNLFSALNRSYLIELLKNKPKFSNRYVSKSAAGNPKFSNEKDYGDFNANPALLYLALTRYWNAINYFDPVQDLIPKNWTEVFRIYLPQFIAVSNFEDYLTKIKNLTSEIRDGHGFVRSEIASKNRVKFPPLDCQSFEDGVYISNVYPDSSNELKIKVLDKIIAIDGKSIEQKFLEISKITSSSNDYYLSKSTYYLRATTADTMIITVERNGEILIDTLRTSFSWMKLSKPTKSEDSMSRLKSYYLIKDSITGKKYGYIDLGELKRNEIDWRFKCFLRKVDDIVIDVRNYPNWTVLKLTHLLIKGKCKFAKFKQINYDYPGSFVWTESQTIGNGRKEYEGTIYILVDYHTMSQAEYTVMALQQHTRSVVIGGQTAGADGNISFVPFPFGVKSYFSGLGVFYLNGKATQQVGVSRDYQIVQDKSLIEKEQDLILRKAIELIRLK
jgi:carboxyl-terminal processing protease